MTARPADGQTSREFVIEEVTDIRAHWEETKPLLLAMVESQRPHDMRLLRDDWASRWRDHLAELPNALFLVARDGHGRPWGFLNGNVARDFGVFDETPAYVSSIYVAPEFRRKGVATALFKRFEGWSSEQAATSIRLDVITGNNEGFVFWAVSGFVTTGFSLEHLEVPNDR